MTCGMKGEPACCLVSVGPTITAKASSEGWRLRLRPNKYYQIAFHSLLSPICLDGERTSDYTFCDSKIRSPLHQSEEVYQVEWRVNEHLYFAEYENNQKKSLN
jgi:hypothetical protein